MKRNVKKGTDRVQNHVDTELLLLWTHLVVIWTSVNEAFLKKKISEKRVTL